MSLPRGLVRSFGRLTPEIAAHYRASFQQTRAALQGRIDAANADARVIQLRTQLSALQTQYQNRLNALQQTQSNINAVNTQINNFRPEIQTSQDAIDRIDVMLAAVDLAQASGE